MDDAIVRCKTSASFAQPALRSSTTLASLSALRTRTSWERRVHEIFTHYELNDDGYLDRRDLIRVLNALHIGVSETQVDKMVLEADADRDGKISVDEFLQWVFKDRSDQSIMLESAYQARMLKMIGDNADLEKHLDDGATPLLSAAEAGYHHVVRLLIQHRADVSARGPKPFPYYGGTALTVAADRGHIDAVAVCIECKVDINATNAYDKPALYLAAERGSEQIVRALLAAGADDTKLVKDRSAALEFLFKHHRVICPLSGASGRPSSRLERRRSVDNRLLEIAESGARNDLEELITHHCGVNIRNSNGYTPLMLIVKRPEMIGCVEKLLEARAEVNIKSSSGSTAAMWAAKRRNDAALRLLAQHGANLIEKAPENHRYFSNKNTLQIYEKAGGDMKSLVPDIEWDSPAMNLTRMIDSIVGGSSLLTASLYLALWDMNDKVRNPRLVMKLSNLLFETLTQCQNLTLSDGAKAVQTLILNAGFLRALDPEELDLIKNTNNNVLYRLEKQNDRRQAELKRISSFTDGQNVHLEHRDRNGQLVMTKPDQRDAMPHKLWKWLDDFPTSSFQRLYCAFECFVAVDADAQSFSRFLTDQGLLYDQQLYARVAADVLIAYAEVVNEHFKTFMFAAFGKAWHPGPLKRISRIMTKMTEDHPELSDTDATVKEQGLRCCYFELADIVRGSLVADGDEEMVSRITQLKTLSTRHGEFECWRIKNTHHKMPGEEVVGGYRDVKAIGRFSAPGKTPGGLPISLVVEIQVIDVQFLAIKKFMHRPYCIARGDYG